MGSLTVKQVESASDGKHADGNNLYLVVKGSRRRWLFRYQSAGKRSELGLGVYPALSLKEARLLAMDLNQAQQRGEDVRKARDAALNRVDTPATFEDCATALIDIKRPEWTNKKHADQWTNTPTTYAYPVIGRVPVNQVTVDHIIKILKPLWHTKTETARRVRQRMEKVLGWAKQTGKRTGENPAAWNENLEFLLASPAKFQKAEHHPSLPWKELPRFVLDLRRRHGVIMLATEFLVLTASRFDMVRGARFEEFDWEKRVWTVPATRTKRNIDHQVPLTKRMIAIVEYQRERVSGEFVFPGRTAERVSTLKPAISKSRETWLDAHGAQITIHGFRSTFREWVAEHGSYHGDIGEHALHHAVGNAVERSYQRSTLLEARRPLMQDWEGYALSCCDAS